MSVAQTYDLSSQYLLSANIHLPEGDVRKGLCTIPDRLPSVQGAEMLIESYWKALVSCQIVWVSTKYSIHSIIGFRSPLLLLLWAVSVSLDRADDRGIMAFLWSTGLSFAA